MPEQSSSFNLSDVASVAKKRWKWIVWFVVICLLMTTLLLFFVLPKYYKSSTTIVAANPELADKGRLFNKNIRELYSNFGTSDDLDRLLAIAKLSKIAGILVQEFDLPTYYNISSGDTNIRRSKALIKLQDDLTIEKTALNELRIEAVTKSPDLSANLVNRMTDLVQQTEQTTWEQTYKSTAAQLNNSLTKLEDEYLGVDSSVSLKADGTGSSLKTIRKEQLLEQIKDLRKEVNENKIAFGNAVPALIVLEKAYPSAVAYKPKKLYVLIAALLISFVFALIAALIYDRKSS